MIIFKVIVMLGCILLGYLVGYSVGVRQGKRRERDHLRQVMKRREEERKKREAEICTEEERPTLMEPDKEAAVIPPPAKHVPEPFQTQTQPPVSRPPAAPVHMVNALTPEQISSVYSRFTVKKLVKLDFNYTFPDSILFTEGEGYIVSSTGELLPNREVYSNANLITGYAMNGLLRVFDASVNGTVYDFNQIMDGKLGKGYARIVGIETMAEVQPSMGYGSFTLKQKGCLRVELLE